VDSLFFTAYHISISIFVICRPWKFAALGPGPGGPCVNTGLVLMQQYTNWFKKLRSLIVYFKFHWTESRSHKTTHQYLQQIEPQCILIFRNAWTQNIKKRIFTSKLKLKVQVYHGEYIKHITFISWLNALNYTKLRG